MRGESNPGKKIGSLLCCHYITHALHYKPITLRLTAVRSSLKQSISHFYVHVLFCFVLFIFFWKFFVVYCLFLHSFTFEEMEIRTHVYKKIKKKEKVKNS